MNSVDYPRRARLIVASVVLAVLIVVALVAAYLFSPIAPCCALPPTLTP